MVERADGTWHGMLTLTITNHGEYEAPAQVEINLPQQLTATASGTSGCRTIDAGFTWCDRQTLAAGASRTLHVEFVATGDPTANASASVFNQGDQGVYPDPNGDNNKATFRVVKG
jgi:phenylacetate-coenzyme A ligase PaaK-like adenylate-forming protein